jgi:type II secretory ATPase GspE/PulE/Tfp pilus assembly ATPase PilB-like protein
MIFSWALKLGSSDVHFDNYQDYVILRFRIDWVLVDIFTLTKAEYKLILQKIKYSSHLKLNIENIPQDWKYDLMIWDKKIDIRISSLPTKFWENIVARLLDSSEAIINFEDLWFFWSTKRILEEVIKKKNWLILVTWPTGSGKTTTLYTILSKINSRDKKIITLEDPVEYQMDWIIQSEIDEKAWFNFAIWLRALLRQDPDVIMVWEIRDKETLDIATTASLTWHLVLSTLHTKSAADTLDRLINMWLEPYILASALDVVIAQRLVRKICPYCKKEVKKTHSEEILIENILRDIWIKWLKAKNVKLYKWEGCEKCNNSWYKGRIWIFEILVMTPKLRELVRAWATVWQIMEEAKKWDMISMKEDWILKAMKWFTTIEEVLRVI